jgi:predicted DNA-binding transcriptional regulator AlpA
MYDDITDTGPDDRITFQEACELLGVARSTLELQIRNPASDLPRPYRLGAGRRRFFSRRVLEAYLTHKVRATASCRAACA